MGEHCVQGDKVTRQVFETEMALGSITPMIGEKRPFSEQGSLRLYILPHSSVLHELEPLPQPLWQFLQFDETHLYTIAPEEQGAIMCVRKVIKSFFFRI